MSLPTLMYVGSYFILDTPPQKREREAKNQSEKKPQDGVGEMEATKHPSPISIVTVTRYPLPDRITP